MQLHEKFFSLWDVYISRENVQYNMHQVFLQLKMNYSNQQCDRPFRYV